MHILAIDCSGRHTHLLGERVPSHTPCTSSCSCCCPLQLGQGSAAGALRRRTEEDVAASMVLVGAEEALGHSSNLQDGLHQVCWPLSTASSLHGVFMMQPLCMRIKPERVLPLAVVGR